MLDTVGFVGGLDVHKGHCCGLALFIFVVTEDLDTLNSTEPFEILLNSVFPYVLREVTHPEVSGLADHGVGRVKRAALVTLYQEQSAAC